MKNVVQDLTSAGIDWQREKWQSGLGSKFIHQGEKNAAKYADEVIVLSKGVQNYFKETYGRETHFMGNDLFDNATSIKRIICPAENAYSKLEAIKSSIRLNVEKDTLILGASRKTPLLFSTMERNLTHRS